MNNDRVILENETDIFIHKQGSVQDLAILEKKHKKTSKNRFSPQNSNLFI
jgi:hypothetical protein